VAGKLRSVGWSFVLASACLSAACGEDAPEPDYYIGASAAWSWIAATPAALGYTIALVLQQGTPGHPTAPCRRAPGSTRLTVNGADVPLTTPDPGTGCLAGQFASPPVLGPVPVTARIEEEGRLIGEVTFDNLTPGTAATVVSPAGGQVRAGDEILLAPPSALPTDVLGRVVFYPLDESDWVPDGILLPLDASERLLDGIHVRIPVFTGPAALILDGMPPFVIPDIACPGFAACIETIEVTLGPIMLTGAP
jgi:hypothetical protein